MLTPDDLARGIERAIDEAVRERGQMNILIAGRTGVGKSTLINAVFQGRLAETGQGRPVTRDTREITKEGIPLSIWDTRGLELADFSDTLRELERLVSQRKADPDPTRHLHVAWLCIQEDGRRVEQAEIELHDMLARHMPVIAVVTKARADQGFRAEVQRLLPNARNVVRVRALPDHFDDGHVLPAMGLADLVELTSEVIPEGHRQALAAAQTASLELKRRRARRIVATATSTAAATGATPIPFADAAILVPVQVSMLAGIAATFGLPVTRVFLTTLVSTAVGTSSATFIGRAIVGGLLKLVPGAGSLAGGAINAATASALTAALGEAFIAALSTTFEPGHEPPSQEAVAAAFREKLGASRARPG